MAAPNPADAPVTKTISAGSWCGERKGAKPTSNAALRQE
jgi:hypothetical protein